MSTDVFCLAPPGLPPSDLPKGCLGPNYILRRVIAGVRDFGNRMGVPTANGSLHFHRDFRAKPTVIVGAYGILRRNQARKGRPRPGDRVIVVGGRTGRDGIHGATFSSGAMTEKTAKTSSSAVQIANAIEQKRTADALLQCAEEGLIRAINDCGAGGFSSAAGEMGRETGLHLELEKAPLKYTGLAPWEVLLSESQERMVIAVDPKDAERVLAVCLGYNAEATIIGKFTNDKMFLATHGGEIAVNLAMDFLAAGYPKKALKASWARPDLKEPEIPRPARWNEMYLRVMSHLNVCSKEPIVRQYDHGVQGTNALAPYSGANHDGPNDAVVLTPILGKPYGLVVSHGLNPILNRIDPYWGGIWAGVEALANLTAVGGNPREAALINNYIWPVPDEQNLGALNMSVDAVVALMDAFGIPVVSGKDSLSSTYRRGGELIEIPPVLCISAFGRIPDVRKTVTADFKEPGSYIVFVGNLNPDEMGGSIYYDLHGALGNSLPKVDLALAKDQMRVLHRLIQRGLILSCHDVSEGGVAAALAEMCFGGELGAAIDLELLGAGRPDFLFFNEMAGCFLVEVREGALDRVLGAGMNSRMLGATTSKRCIDAAYAAEPLFSVGLDELKRAWQGPMKEVFR